jgi:uncharacterized lipoprotein YmbA
MQLLKSLAVAAALVVLGGCAGSEKPATRFYVLSALPGDTAPLEGVRREPPVTVDVGPLRLPQYLERPQIVTRTASNELALADYHQWGGSLAKNTTQVLARNLSILLATPDVTVFSRRPPAATDVRVEVDVLQFERGPDGRVALSARWRVRPGGDDATGAAHSTDLASDMLEPTAGFDATVAAMSGLLGELSRGIATAVAEQAR